MSVLAVGSVAFDNVVTPYGKADRMLGGSATYFALAASYFTEVRVVAVVGDDFGEEELKVFREHGISTEGLEHAPGKSFFWESEYSDDLSDRRTLATHLNVFAGFEPKIPEAYRGSEFLFLGNIDPELQRSVQLQMDGTRLVAGDTMNYWIERKPEELRRTLAGMDVLLINDSEARQLSGEHNLLRAARKIQNLGPRMLIVKRGEFGACLYGGGRVFAALGFPLEDVRDPTGAGDSFAGGFLGYLASRGGSGAPDEGALRQAMIYGSVMGSFCVEDFGTRRLQSLTRAEIEERYRQFKELTHFE